MYNLENKVIWITGASSGIGEACAYELSKYQTSLILTSRNKMLLESVKQKCIANGSKCEILAYDLDNIENINDLVYSALSIYGHIDIMFHNAGISQRGIAGDTLFEVDEKIMKINFFSSIKISKLLLAHFVQRKQGTFIVTTSISGKFGFPLRSAYSASKHALYGYYESIEAEYYKDNIKVLFVCPGRVHTNISLNALDHNGVEHAKLDEGQAQGIQSNEAAKKIIKAIKKQKTEVYVGSKEILMVYIKRFFPKLSKIIVRKIKPT